MDKPGFTILLQKCLDSKVIVIMHYNTKDENMLCNAKISAAIYEVDEWTNSINIKVSEFNPTSRYIGLDNYVELKFNEEFDFKIEYIDSPIEGKKINLLFGDVVTHESYFEIYGIEPGFLEEIIKNMDHYKEEYRRLNNENDAIDREAGESMLTSEMLYCINNRME